LAASQHHCQWLIIQGRFSANPLTGAGAFGRQQGHPVSCARVDRGAWALRSLTAIAERRTLSMPATCGSASVRDEACPHDGQSAGRSYAVIGRIAVNEPHVAHS
jgi:hypothetical protein